MSLKNRINRNRLFRSWIGIIVVYSLTVSAGHIIIREAWLPIYSKQWLIGAFAISFYIIGFVWYNLDKHRTLIQIRLFLGLGLANLISLTRGLFLFSLAGFMLLPQPEGFISWIPGLLYGFSLVGDYLDGYAARRFDSETILGAKLDEELDSLGVLIASLVAYSYGMIPIWVLITVGSARYVFVFGKWIRKKIGKPVFELTDKSSRLIIGDTQRIFLFIAILPLFGSSFTRIIASILMIPFLVGFVRDWLIVIGAIESDS